MRLLHIHIMHAHTIYSNMKVVKESHHGIDTIKRSLWNTFKILNWFSNRFWNVFVPSTVILWIPSPFDLCHFCIPSLSLVQLAYFQSYFRCGSGIIRKMIVKSALFGVFLITLHYAAFHFTWEDIIPWLDLYAHTSHHLHNKKVTCTNIHTNNI